MLAKAFPAVPGQWLEPYQQTYLALTLATQALTCCMSIGGGPIQAQMLACAERAQDSSMLRR